MPPELRADCSNSESGRLGRGPRTYPQFRAAHHSGFSEELRAAGREYLAGHGDYRYGNVATVLKAVALAAASGGLFYASLQCANAMTFVCLYVAAVVAAVMLSVNTLHDASHGALFRSAALNAITMRIVSLPLGFEPVYWQARHVRYHHPHANIEHHDLDTAANRFLRQTPFQQWYPQFRFQHLYWPLIAGLSMSYIGWVYDWSDRLGTTPLASDRLLPGVRGWTLFVASKLFHLGAFLIFPLATLGPDIGHGAVVAAYVLGQIVASCVLLTLILGTHWADTHFYDVSDGNPLPHTRDEHAFLTCCDWSPGWRFASHWLGGLNHHLTHHLFPSYSHRHYAALAEIVEHLAARHGLPYRCLRYGELLRAQQRFLKSMGARPDHPHA
ncbi:acyl-CoA desaturase [Trinickia caryophylli]|uniref:Linoleoyl-CoA desaturase n=1 Tax=Trinickia caryophylli TaxID=28094 RepID=A0A1X7EI47_TRICW|nr:acyl-CoA desaturase [Trinickia caryophylli]TRX14486.1 acyl-CoA desaturase [Trinickia caryophylli]SMF33937.1 linoleoyl-CoA desaturase [Trinickia caryophylli]